MSKQQNSERKYVITAVPHFTHLDIGNFMFPYILIEDPLNLTQPKKQRFSRNSILQGRTRLDQCPRTAHGTQWACTTPGNLMYVGQGYLALNHSTLLNMHP